MLGIAFLMGLILQVSAQSRLYQPAIEAAIAIKAAEMEDSDTFVQHAMSAVEVVPAAECLAFAQSSATLAEQVAWLCHPKEQIATIGGNRSFVNDLESLWFLPEITNSSLSRKFKKAFTNETALLEFLRAKAQMMKKLCLTQPILTKDPRETLKANCDTLDALYRDNIPHFPLGREVCGYNDVPQVLDHQGRPLSVGASPIEAMFVRAEIALGALGNNPALQTVIAGLRELRGEMPVTHNEMVEFLQGLLAHPAHVQFLNDLGLIMVDTELLRLVNSEYTPECDYFAVLHYLDVDSAWNDAKGPECQIRDPEDREDEHDPIEVSIKLRLPATKWLRYLILNADNPGLDVKYIERELGSLLKKMRMLLRTAKSSYNGVAYVGRSNMLPWFDEQGMAYCPAMALCSDYDTKGPYGINFTACEDLKSEIMV